MSSLRTSEEDISRALARAALDEQVEEEEFRRVPSLLDLKCMRAHLYVFSNNQCFNLFANMLHRSGVQVPENWVYDNTATIRVMNGGPDGYFVTMIYPGVVSNTSRFISPEAFNAALAASGHKHLDIPKDKVIYFCRHGHGLHNIPETSAKDARDAKLTELGIKQALQAGQVIAADALQLGVVELKVYFSDLIRTMETAYHIVKQFPEHMRPKRGEVCIESHEATRPIGGKHHWSLDDLLRRIAMDPYAPIEALRELAPGKTDAEIERMRVENWAINDPIGDPENCIKCIGDHEFSLEIDWSDYVAKLQEAKAKGETFGDAASKTLFIDIVLRNARMP